MFDVAPLIFYYSELARHRYAQQIKQSNEEAEKLKAMTAEEQSAYLSYKQQAKNEALRLREVQALERIADLLANPRPQEIKLDHKFF
jgi:hypothetical protein